MMGAMKLQELTQSQVPQSIFSSKDQQPEIDERVIVIARGFRCLGYIDESGAWRHDSDGAPIENVLHWTRNRRP